MPSELWQAGVLGLVQGLTEYKGKRLKAVDQGEVTGAEIDEETKKRFQPLLQFLKEKLTDIQEILRIPLIGVVPESETVLDASNQGLPAVHIKGSDVSEAYKDVVARFLGGDRPMRFVDAPKQGLFKRMFGGR